MIVDLLLYIIGLFLKTVATLFGAISLVIPAWVQTTIHTAVGYMSYLQPILPITHNAAATGLWQTIGLIDIAGFVLQVIVCFYLVKLVIMLFGMMPFVGKYIHLPGHEEKQNVEYDAQVMHGNFKSVMKGRDKISTKTR